MAGRPGKSGISKLAESIRGEHMPIAAAAALARSYLVAGPADVFDGPQLTAMLELIARALCTVAPVYALDARTGERRQLAETELHGAIFRHGASVLVLEDGTALSGVSITRGDLRKAVAVLRAIGIEAIAPRAVPPPAPLAPAREGEGAAASLAASAADIEALLRPAPQGAQLDRINALAIGIARSAARGPVAGLAMRLMSALHDARAKGAPAQDAAVIGALSRLRQAIEEASGKP